IGSAIELQARMSAWHDARTLRFAGADSTTEGQDASVRLVGRGAWQFDGLAYVQSRNFTNLDPLRAHAGPAQHPGDRYRREDRSAPAGRR
ncbi:MAG: hypothetical protein ACK4ZA_05530, partial [Tsuneonella troitsensis]